MSISQSPGGGIDPREPWYWQGLRFSCQRCGRCCGGEPGFVWLTEQELVRMAEFLGLSRQVFVPTYLRRVGNRWSLREKPNGDCIMYHGGCLVYPVRPGQCRTFPFWDVNLRSPSSWRQLSLSCPGIGQGRLYSLAEIEHIRIGKAEAQRDAFR